MTGAPDRDPAAVARGPARVPHRSRPDARHGRRQRHPRLVLRRRRLLRPGLAVAHGLELVADGADLVDVGGESTRPGAHRVDADEELRRVLPVVRGLVAEGVVVSIDTMRADVAAACLAAGAAVVNDVSGGLADDGMAAVVAVQARVMRALGVSNRRPQGGHGQGRRAGRPAEAQRPLVHRSPLTTLDELEAMSMAVRGKLAGWTSLRATLADHVGGIDLGELIARSEEHLATLGEIHNQPRPRTSSPWTSPDGR